MIELARERGVYEQPSKRLGDVANFIASLANDSRYQLFAAFVFGTFIGAMLDAFLRNADPKLVAPSTDERAPLEPEVELGADPPLNAFYRPVVHQSRPRRYSPEDARRLSNVLHEAFEILNIQGESALSNGSDLSRKWIALIKECGAQQYTIMIKEYLGIIGKVQREIGILVERNGFYRSELGFLLDPPEYQRPLQEGVEVLAEALKRLPQEPDNNLIMLLMPQHNIFTEGVGAAHRWVRRLKDRIVAMRKTINDAVSDEIDT